MLQCSIALGKFNCAVLLKQSSFAIKSGIEQRDGEINAGTLDATILLYKDYIFIMTGTFSSFNTIDDSMQKDKSNAMEILLSQLGYKTNDVIIMGIDSEELQRGQFGIKKCCSFIMMNHEKHTL